MINKINYYTNIYILNKEKVKEIKEDSFEYNKIENKIDDGFIGTKIDLIV